MTEDSKPCSITIVAEGAGAVMYVNFDGIRIAKKILRDGVAANDLPWVSLTPFYDVKGKGKNIKVYVRDHEGGTQ